jgi:hypothetical protein
MNKQIPVVQGEFAIPLKKLLTSYLLNRFQLDLRSLPEGQLNVESVVAFQTPRRDRKKSISLQNVSKLNFSLLDVPFTSEQSSARIPIPKPQISLKSSEIEDSSNETCSSSENSTSENKISEDDESNDRIASEEEI